jgi:LysR family carnitine catabolism transcriptional activator
MALHELSARQLRAFVAVADLRSFTRGAVALHLSQPAFSALIRSLEDEVGARLFERATRNIHLTPEGELFAPSARRLLADMDRTFAEMGDHVERRKGRVHIAALPSLAAGWLPGVFAEFRAAWPGIELGLSDQLSDPCHDLVRGGKADFALASGATKAGDAADLALQPLFTERFHLVCRADHPLAREPRLTLRKLAPWDFIHMTRNSSVRQALEAALHPLAMNTVLEVEQLATVMGMVEAGLGISVVPTLTLYQFRRETIAVRPLPLPRLSRRIYLVQRREGALSAAARTLRDLVVARLAPAAD